MFWVSILNLIFKTLCVLLLIHSFSEQLCADGNDGFLRVKSLQEGTFENYLVSKENPIQFVSDSVLSFNKENPLKPGRYLILADCSSEFVTIIPGVTKELVAHSVKFQTPHEAQSKDLFSIQCERFGKALLKQSLKNKFSLNVLSGERSLLVSMKPFSIKLNQAGDDLNPREQIYKLAAIQVENSDKLTTSPQFYVSPSDNFLSVTESQNFGSWQFLLPGKYFIEVNGTKQEVDLKEGEIKSIKPGFLKVVTSEKVNLSRHTEINGTPAALEINAGHLLSFNDIYPVLPGKIEVFIGKVKNAQSIQVKDGETAQLETRSILVDLGCGIGEWGCLGKEGVYLYHSNQLYPFSEGTSDVPILFFDRDIWFGLKGSRNIRYRIPPEKRDYVVQIGHVELIPTPLLKTSHITDLVRVESQRKDGSITGYTFDVPFERSIKMPLLSGDYFLVEYISKNGLDGERRRIQTPFKIVAGSVERLSFNVFISEKKMLQMKKSKDAQ